VGRTRIGVVLALSVLLGGGAVTARAASPALYFTFNAGRTFSGALADGTPVGTSTGAPTVIPAGTYNVYLNDQSGAVMQFDLQGPGVQLDNAMSFGEEVNAAFLETFAPSSTYTFHDDLQPGGTVWTFVTSSTVVPSSASVTSPLPLPSSAGSTSHASTTAAGDVVGSKVTPFRGTLVASVSAAGAVTLTSKGKTVTSILTGRYSIDVHDQSKRGGFTLQEIRKNARTVTTSSFVGTRTVTVTLGPGQWFFYPSFIGRKTYFIVRSA
jgi:hypothetical protein